ncbi:MAG TPA: flavin reductase family protein [Bacillota bacterium]|nr:flavin reductase family protein [Bacillota bacterium]
MKEIKYSECANETVGELSKGAFLTSQAEGRVNSMTIGWGSVGFMWGKPVFMVMVRSSRYTHELLAKSTEFTVTIPRGDLKEALKLCGTKSGRDMDKLAAAGLKTRAGSKTATPVLDCAGIHYECKIVYRQDMSEEQMTAEVKDKWYGSDPLHTLYFGEILASYETE